VSRSFGSLPRSIEPYVFLNEISEPVSVLPGPFRLKGPGEGTLDSPLVFHWLPSPVVAFEGPYSGPAIDLDVDYSLVSDEPPLEVPVLITRATLGACQRVRGILQGALNLGDQRFESVRLCLANFTDYFGQNVRYQRGSSVGGRTGRLSASSDIGELRLDEIPVDAELRKIVRQEAGFVISHVGQWLPPAGGMTVADAESALNMLRVWFGLLNGAWSGPLFPEGLVGGQIAWRQIAAWRLGDGRHVTSWMPRKHRLELSAMLTGFVRLWHDANWRAPLKSAVSWLVEANSSSTGLESRIILAQVALELLSWVELVETHRLHSRADFGRLSAAGRIRSLLQHAGVPAAVPDHFDRLRDLLQDDAFDGPGIVTRIRNAVVHATEHNRAVVDSLDGQTLYECGQLALQYVELALLAACGYRGHYARRSWKGWKGSDEVLVPWAEAG